METTKQEVNIKKIEYYAKNIDKNGKEIDLSKFIDDEGALDVSHENLTGTLISNAKKVNCEDNKFTKLDLPNAKEVFCEDNQLTSFNLSNAEQVYCSHNNLTSLDLPMVKDIDCSFNLLTSLNLPNAEDVHCENNQLTSLNLPNAKEVFCYNNQLTSLKAPKAKEVFCEVNPLKALVEYNEKRKEAIWSQKIGDTIYTYIGYNRFTLDQAKNAINKEYEPKEAEEYIKKVIESQEAVN